ncbi:MAG: cbb3-type cytochrome c oxidase subunit I [Ilumatobacteraceae bacterium]
MTTIESSPETVAADAADDGGGDNSLDTMVGSFASTDHKVIGKMFVGAGALGLLAIVVVNILVGVERVDGDNAALAVDAWAQLLDGQRVSFVFGALLPLALGLTLSVVPLQLGSRALAFPRLATFGFWAWLGGAVLIVIALSNDGGTSGGEADMVGLFIGAHALMAIGIAAAAGTLATSVLTTRAPGMTMRRVPFFSWSALVFALGLLLVMPVLLGTLVYLFLDHRNGRTGFGGNEGITEWAGWVFTQPTTFVMAVPAIGVFVELVPITFRRRTPARGVFFAGLALVAFAALAGVTQRNIFALPWSGPGLNLDDLADKVDDLVPYFFFNVIPVIGVSIVSLMALYLAIPQKGTRVNVTPAFAFAFFGFGMILLGMLGSALYAINDVGLQQTVFEEGVLVLVVYGSVLALMGGLTHWSPKLFGVALSAGSASLLALLGVIGTILAALPLYVAGFLDQPAGLAYADDDLQAWNIIALVGHGLMAVTVLGFLALMALAVRKGQDLVDDPWDGQTVEWTTSSPAPMDNYVEVPVVQSAEPLLDLEAAAGNGNGNGNGSEN